MAFTSWTTTQDKYIAQSQADTYLANAEILAKDIGTVCEKQGTVMVNNKDLCDKGEAVLENPTSAIAGPAGKDGENGKDGLPGANGKDGVPGVNGKDGPPGTNGTNGIDGIGLAGTDGTDGQDGRDGQDGIDGKDGQSVTSFNWSDSKTGQKYNCIPEPEGSSSSTCTAEEPAPPAPVK